MRLDTGQADTFVFTSRSGSEPVNLNGDEFRNAVEKRAWEVRPSTRPQEVARKLFAANLTIRWFKYTDGRITINTAFIPP